LNYLIQFLLFRNNTKLANQQLIWTILPDPKLASNGQLIRNLDFELIQENNQFNINQNESDDNIEETIKIIFQWFLQNLMEETAYYASTNPTTYIEAKNCQNSQKWQKAIELELNTLKSQGTWTLVESLKDRKILKGKWIYKTKPGNIYKAWWIVKSFLQLYGLDYNETFINKVKPIAFRTLFAIAAILDWKIDQLDIKCAFSNAPIDEEIYMHQPTSFEAKKGLVCKLNKVLYGFKQSARQWQQFLTSKLKAIGFSPIFANQSIYIKDNIIFEIHIDNIFIIAKNQTIIKDIKANLVQTLEVSDLRPIRLFLRIEIFKKKQIYNPIAKGLYQKDNWQICT